MKMNNQKLPKSILFLDNNKFDLYSPVKKSILSFQFPPEAVKDNEIIEKELLLNAVKTFLENNKIEPSSIIIVLGSSLLFEKEFIKDPKENDAQLKEKIQQFIDIVPFEEVGSISQPLSKSIKVTTANADFYKTIMNCFRQFEFNIQIILPSSLYNPSIKSLNVDSLKIIFAKTDSLKQYNLKKESITVMEIKQAEIKKKNYLMTFLAFSMFIVAGILIAYALFFLK